MTTDRMVMITSIGYKLDFEKKVSVSATSAILGYERRERGKGVSRSKRRYERLLDCHSTKGEASK